MALPSRGCVPERACPAGEAPQQHSDSGKRTCRVPVWVYFVHELSSDRDTKRGHQISQTLSRQRPMPAPPLPPHTGDGFLPPFPGSH